MKAPGTTDMVLGVKGIGRIEGDAICWSSGIQWLTHLTLWGKKIYMESHIKMREGEKASSWACHVKVNQLRDEPLKLAVNNSRPSYQSSRRGDTNNLLGNFIVIPIPYLLVICFGCDLSFQSHSRAIGNHGGDLAAWHKNTFRAIGCSWGLSYLCDCLFMEYVIKNRCVGNLKVSAVHRSTYMLGMLS